MTSEAMNLNQGDRPGTIQGTNQSQFKTHSFVCSWDAGELVEQRERQSSVS